MVEELLLMLPKLTRHHEIKYFWGIILKSLVQVIAWKLNAKWDSY